MGLFSNQATNDEPKPQPETRWARKAREAVDQGLTVWIVSLGERPVRIGGGRPLDGPSKTVSEVESSGLWRMDHIVTFSGTAKAGSFGEHQHELVAVFRRT